MRHPLSGRGALLADFGISMAAALSGKPRRGRMNLPRDGAAFDVDFVNRQAYVIGQGICSPSDVISYSGGAGGTRVNSAGVIVAATGPRLDHSPVTMACSGLLIEEQRTNLLTFSAQFDNAVWGAATTVSYTVSPDSATAPDGTLSADKLIVPNGNALTFQGSGYLANNAMSMNYGTLAIGSYAFTTFVKKGEYDRYQLRVGNNSSLSAGSYALALFDLNGAGTILASSGTQGAVTASMMDAGNGWWRLSVSFPLTAATAVFVGGWVWNSAASTGNGVNGLYVWGAQLEAGAFATSYIPTTSAAVTRTADSVSINAANFSSWFNTARGSFAVEFDTERSAAPSPSVGVLGFSTLDAFVYVANATGQISAFDGAAVSSGIVGVGAGAHKVASAYTAGSAIAIAADGKAVISAAHCAAGYTSGGTLNIGSLGTATTVLCGHVKRISYWPRQDTDDQLQALTA
jgi:hypothetical protein